jgi:mannose-6-phosphate isomerase
VSAWPISPEPFRIEPIFSPRLWGSRSLAPLFPEKSHLAEPLGEAWLTGVDCKIATGPFAEKTLGAAWHEMPANWRGTRLASCAEFPILVKFIFPNDKLSIQVHPDDAYAARHEQAAGGRGKTEMWHAVSSEPGASLLLGLKPGTDKKKFLDAMKENGLEDIFQSHIVNAGDTFFVAPGTAHTIGPHMILCEVQEYSDLTYRVYDYGRVDDKGQPRELHIEKALEVMKFGAPAPSKVIPLQLPGQPGATKTLLSACSYFAAERWELRATTQTQSTIENFEIFVILDGTGSIHWQGAPLPYRRGDCWFIPATLGEFSFQPEQRTAAIRTFVPDLPGLRKQLRKADVTESRLAQTVFA